MRQKNIALLLVMALAIVLFSAIIRNIGPLKMQACAADAFSLHAVSFDSNGGSYVAPYTNVEPYALIEKPPVPSKSGATFEGWFREPELQNEWDFKNDNVTADMTLYAKWAQGYIITVTDGYADRRYASMGERVMITADTPNYWSRFEMWISLSGGVRFADPYRSRTTFIMPDRPVQIRAVYRYYGDHTFTGGCSTGTGGILPFLAFVALRAKSRKKRK